MAEQLSFLLPTPPTILPLGLLSRSPTPKEVDRMLGAGRYVMGVAFTGGAVERFLYPRLGTVGSPSCLWLRSVVWGHTAKVLRVGRKAGACANRLPNSCFSAWSELAHVHFYTLAYTLDLDLGLSCFLNSSGGSRPP